MFMRFSVWLLDLREQFQPRVYNIPQEEAVELSGTVKHIDSGECDCGSHWRLHLLRIQRADGEK